MFPRLADKVAYIPNGAPLFDVPEDVSLATVRGLGLEPGKYVLGVGRLVPEKGFDCLIDAFRKSALSDCKLAIVGGSDHDSAYAEKLQEKADSSVLLLGKRPRRTLASLYLHCRCFVLPSSHEALAIVALEAAACGAPTIMSDITANRNFGLPDSHYFPLDDSDALARLLCDLPHNFASENKRLVKTFSWDDSARLTERLYASLANMRATNIGAAATDAPARKGPGK
jgi:glycosyltransferase involved in cell wall biosynthesis